MTIQFIGKLTGVLALTLGLAGCIDATVDVEVQSETNAKAVMTQKMGADIYSMVKMGAAQAKEGATTTETPGTETAAEDEFCAGGELTEGSDGGATCVMSSEGAFADVKFGDTKDEDTAVFTSAGPGLVKVAFPTKDMAGEIGAGEGAMDEETKQMMQAFFEGHTITLRVHGGEITDTNMTKAGDGQSAETVIPFLDLINGTAELPEELYAVVKVN
jgi:hypothetical protein